MDVFYEESAVNQNANRGRKIYKVLNIISWIFIFLCLIFAFCTIMLIPNCNDKDKADYGFYLFNCLFMLGLSFTFFLGWFIFYQLKKRVNISFDYIFILNSIPSFSNDDKCHKIQMNCWMHFNMWTSWVSIVFNYFYLNSDEIWIRIWGIKKHKSEESDVVSIQSF